MNRILRKSLFVSLLPLVLVAVVCGDALRLHVEFAGTRNALAGFASAMQDDSGLDRTLQAHYVRLNEDNRLTGQISAINDNGVSTGVGGLEVNLVKNSRVVNKTTTERDGTFLTGTILPGSYTLCVAGQDGFLAYGIQVIDREQQPQDRLPVPLPGQEEAAVPATPNHSDVAVHAVHPVRAGQQPVAQAAWHAGSRHAGGPVGQDVDPIQLTAAVIPPEFSALQRIMSDYVPEGISISMAGTAGSRINVEQSVVVGGFQVSLTSDGNLEGRIASLTGDQDQPIRLQEMNAFLLLNDEIYSRVTVQEDGNFVFNSIEPGVYGFAAAGPDGFAAMSFQAVVADDEDASTSTAGPGDFRNASAPRRRASKDLQVAIAPADDLPWLRDKINDLNRVNPPIDPALADAVPVDTVPGGGPVGGGGGFGGTGGGYGQGGIGAFGDWIGAGLAAWVLTEAIGNNNNVATPPVVTPGPMTPITAQ